MTQTYYQFIKNLREEKNLSQVEVAKRIGLSRSSYISFEQGKTDLSLSAAGKLADIFGLSITEVESGLKPNYPKYQEMILAYLRQATSADGKITKTKLAKLLYLADFGWFYEQLESMSGMQYRRLQYGPVPDTYFRAIDELEEAGKISTTRNYDSILISENRASAKQNLKLLSKTELALIKKISNKWKNKKTSEIVDFTHNQLPYQICRPDEIIPYSLITQEDPGYVY